MTNPVTPNIGLNKIDRTSPSTTYFDLEKYIDQNADAVDQFAGETNESINALEKRLDTEERREVVLQPGLQIVNAERSAPFKLSGIKGRTLVNLLGRDGNCERADAFSRWFNSNQEEDTTNKVFGSGSLKITVTTSVDKTGGIFKVMTPLIKSNSYYILKCYFKNIDLPDSIKPEVLMKVTDSEGDRLVGNYSGNINKNAFTMTYGKAYTKSNLTEFVVYARIPGGSAEVGNSFNIDGFSLYEISASEYDALDNMTLEQVDAKYPYVDSVQSVRNPYVIRYGENLLPPFYEWLSKDSYVTSTDLGLSKATITISNSGTGLFSLIKVKEGQTYAVSVGAISAGARLRIGVNNGSSPTVGTFIADIHEGNKAQVITIPSGVTEIAVVFLNLADYSGGYPAVFSVDSPMITLGSTPKPFKPHEDSMLALQTDLYADPLTGANADDMFEKDGQYFKFAKWKKVVLDGDKLYTFQGPIPGFKWIKFAITDGPSQNKDNAFYMTKFDGKYIRQVPGSLGAGTLPDQLDFDPGNKLVYVSISNTESGWGDNYTPTVDEIKAYFMGWVMRQDGTPDQPYTSGVKFWRTKLDNGNPTNILPTTQAPNWTPYQLVYQLATPTVEPIVSEGMLTFSEGDNQIEVGTGVVVRESVKPYGTATTGGKLVINYKFSDVDTWLKYPLKKFRGIYRNGLLDPTWIVQPAGSAGRGLNFAQCDPANFDPSAAYSVTYLMLDKSPIVPFSGSYVANEKSMLEELTDAVHQNATAVSVLMNKKVDKAAPGWIMPTLLNGWVNRNTGFDGPLSYRRIEGLGVQVRGIIQLGTTGVVFFLPNGYRPERTHFDIVMGYIQSQASYIYPYITITPAGEFRIDAVTTPPSWLIIDTIIPQ